MEHPEPWAKENIARRLSWLRSYVGLSQTEFAASIGVAVTNYNNWEKGKQRLSLDGALKINSVYGTTLDFLYLDRRTSLSVEMSKSFSSFFDKNETIKSKDKPET